LPEAPKQFTAPATEQSTPPDGRKQFIAPVLLVFLFATALTWGIKYIQRPVLRVAILDGMPARKLEEALDRWDAKHQETILVFPLSYGALRDIVMDDKKFPGFDVVMIEDPWVPDLAQRKQISEVPVDLFEDKLTKFVPEFLRVCYYRAAGHPRRPDLDQIISSSKFQVDAGKLSDQPRF
jgi:hypothetical protein